MLKKGHIYRYFDGEVITVERVTQSSAIVRVKLKKKKGGDKKTPTFTISKNSELEEVR
jgi:ribosomal protein L21E